jgi:hypothetical protein
LTTASDLPAIYSRHPVVLWVEDEETRTYLSTAWQDGDIGLLVAGGYENIYGVVKAAEKDGIAHVFGLRDRDFSMSNRARWNEPRVRVFVGESVEVENLLLDKEAMADCDVNTSGKDAPAIDAELRRVAEPLVWWMSCRSTIVQVRDTTIQAFIEHPKRGVVGSKQDALDAIVQSPWWTSTLPRIEPTLKPDEVEQWLLVHHRDYASAFQDGSWRTRFSGKEILGEMRSRLWTRNHQGGLGGKQRFYRSIAEAQRTAGRLPDEVQALRAALRSRVDLPP